MTTGRINQVTILPGVRTAAVKQLASQGLNSPVRGSRVVYLVSSHNEVVICTWRGTRAYGIKGFPSGFQFSPLSSLQTGPPSTELPKESGLTCSPQEEDTTSQITAKDRLLRGAYPQVSFG
jgi:hypothetical protein